MRIAIGGFSQETNVFSPRMTTERDLTLVPGDDFSRTFSEPISELAGFLDVIESTQGTMSVPTMSISAVPGGRLKQSAFETFASEIVTAIEASDPDAVFLSLHGSMVAEHLDDVEGELLRRVRTRVGETTPIGISLDCHAHVTPTMVEQADVMSAYIEHPHTGQDMFRTGRRVAEWTIAVETENLTPVMTLVKLPLISATKMESHRDPLRSLYRRRQELLAGNDGMVEIALFPPQPWVDIDAAGFAVVAITDGDPPLADRTAKSLAERVWTSRHDFLKDFASIGEALELIDPTAKGPLVIADMGDITGGGAPGDSNVILEALLETAATGVHAAMPMVDPGAVSELYPRIGDTVTTEIGGKHSPGLLPLSVTIEVARGYDEPLVLQDEELDTINADISGRNVGRRVVLRVADTDIWVILFEGPMRDIHPSFFTAHDIPPGDMDLLVVKSPYDFYPRYDPLANRIVKVDSPGVCAVDLSTFPFQKARPFFPTDEVDPSFRIFRS